MDTGAAEPQPAPGGSCHSCNVNAFTNSVSHGGKARPQAARSGTFSGSPEWSGWYPPARDAATDRYDMYCSSAGCYPYSAYAWRDALDYAYPSVFPAVYPWGTEYGYYYDVMGYPNYCAGGGGGRGACGGGTYGW
jgi:hypothetical protein